MQWVAADCVLLDPRQAVAANYIGWEPRPDDFSLPAPYQTPRVEERRDGRVADEGDSSSDGGGGDGEAAAAAKHDGPPQRKRRRRSSYQPNAREQQASARHAEYAPLLAAAATAVQSWLAASGAATVQEALSLGGGGGGAVALRARQHQPDDSSAAAGGGEEEPDFRTLLEMRHVLRPKLSFAAPTGDGGGSNGSDGSALAAGGGADPPHGRQQQSGGRLAAGQLPPCNLFGQLLSSGCADAERLAQATVAGRCWPVLLPPRCRFLMCDVRQLQPLLDDAAAGEWAGCGSSPVLPTKRSLLVVPPCFRPPASPPPAPPHLLPHNRFSIVHQPTNCLRQRQVEATNASSWTLHGKTRCAVAQAGRQAG